MTISVRSSKIRDLQHLGPKICSKNKLARYRPKVWKIIRCCGIGPRFVQKQNSFFEHNLEHINVLCQVYIGRPRNVGPRIKRGCFKHLPEKSRISRKAPHFSSRKNSQTGNHKFLKPEINVLCLKNYKLRMSIYSNKTYAQYTQLIVNLKE